MSYIFFLWKWKNETGSEECPIKKRRLIIGGHGDQVFITPAHEFNNDGGDAGAGEGGGPAGGGGVAVAAPAGGVGVLQVSDQLTAEHLFSQQFVLSQRIEDMNREMQLRLSSAREERKRLMNSINRIATQPVIRPRASTQGATTNGGDARANTDSVGRTSRLNVMKNPKDLYVLYHEWEHGYGGQKPAKHWQPHEIGGDTNYSRRRIFWETVEHLLKKNYTADTAVDAIYDKYGKDRQG